MSLPYMNSTSGRSAIDDIRKTLIAFGCTKFAPMEDFEDGTVRIQFEHRGRMVEVTASAKGYAAAYLHEKPWNNRMRTNRAAYERKALEQGQIAVWSILRDWIKGQLTAVECGILSFDGAFLGQILLPDGRTVHSHVDERGLLPQPDDQRRIGQEGDA